MRWLTIYAKERTLLNLIVVISHRSVLKIYLLMLWMLFITNEVKNDPDRAYMFLMLLESVIFSISGRISTLILHNVKNAMWLVVHIHIQRNKGHHKRRTKYYNEEPATFVSTWHLHMYDLWLSTLVQWFICVTLYAIVKFSATCWYTFFRYLLL